MSKEQAELVEKIRALLTKKYGSDSPESMRKLFDSYDVDGDQKIGANELETLLKDASIGNSFTRTMWVKGILDKLDATGDKKIDWEEFSKAVR
jgi:Ca2+-binding EF-hand superfamily protein